MNTEKQALYNISQNLANLRNTINQGCAITNQTNQQVILVNIQAQNELIYNEVIKKAVVNFVNAFGELLNNCSIQANLTKQTLVTNIQQIILNYYNSINPIIFTRYVYVRPVLREHHHGSENGGGNGENGNENTMM